MEEVKWFDRKFDFSLYPEDLPSISIRLQEIREELESVIRNLPERILDYKPAGKWSIKEHIGHLSLLEPIWRTRFLDIKNHRLQLSAADLENKATSNAGFNDYHLSYLLATFANERSATLTMLGEMKEDDYAKMSLHPRLQQPMRITDLAVFIVEHDQHHLAHIRQIIKSSS